MKSILTIIFVYCIGSAIAQTDTVIKYFNSDWEETGAADFDYFRKSFNSDGVWTVIDYYKSGAVQMTGSYKSKKEKKRNGYFTYFRENGQINNSGQYKKDKKVDEWIYYHENGNISSKEFFKKDKLQSYKFFEEDGTEKQGDYDYETPPQYPGGMEEMYKFMGDEIAYPQQALDNNIQGKVYVRFVVDKDGSLTDIEVINGVHSLLDREAVRVISMMPKWNPGKQHNRAVRVRYTIPINFTIN